MLLTSPSMWKMVKNTLNRILEKMIGWPQISREINEEDISLYYQ